MVKLNFRGFGIILIVMLALINFCGYPQENPSSPVEVKGAGGLGLTVEPGGFVLQNLIPGKRVDIFETTGLALVIYNRSDSYHTYVIKGGKPQEVGIEGWLKGYEPIPESSWFKLEQEQVRISPHSKAYVKMYLEIPDEEKLYNQKWVVGLSVAGVPEPGERLVLSAHPSYYLETLGKDGLKEKPWGGLGLEPGVLIIEKVGLGVNKKVGKIKIHNNDSKKHTYNIYSHIPKELAGDRITSSQGYIWIKNEDWLKPSLGKITIQGNSSKELEVDLVIPNEE
ncbi:MAG: hypothetical protein NC822_06515, partial [Candidatus Omnitrophica bacterium]|nr:hypothetical protein [Candidatus Omnitrophota bacterium]